MKGIATFQLLGRVGKVTPFEKLIKVRIAANRPYKGSNGEWQDRVLWNTVTVFLESKRTWIQNNVVPGDLVYAGGELTERSYEKDGAQVYTTDLVASDFFRQATKEQLKG